MIGVGGGGGGKQRECCPPSKIIEPPPPIFRTFTFMDKDMFLDLFKSVVVRPSWNTPLQFGHPCTKKGKIQIENVLQDWSNVYNI